MKKFILCMAVVIMVLTGVSVMNATEVSLSSLTRFDYRLGLDDAFSRADGGNFYIGRSYLTMKAVFSEKVSARLTYDFAKTDDTFDHYFKYAYVDFNIAEPLTVTVGLLKTYFGYSTHWNYPIATGNIVDVVEASSSADLGLGIGGALADGKFSYHLCVVNGEGYKNWQEMDNDNFASIADLNFQYYEKGIFSVSFKYADVDAEIDYSWDAYTLNKFGKVETLVEYVGVMTGDDIQHSIGLFAGFEINEPWLVSALCNYTFESDPAVYLGAVYEPVIGIKIKPMLGAVIANTPSYEFKTEMDVSFNTTIR